MRARVRARERIIEAIGALPCVLEHRESIGEMALRVKSPRVMRGGLAPLRVRRDRHQPPGDLQHLAGAHGARREARQLTLDVAPTDGHNSVGRDRNDMRACGTTKDHCLHSTPDFARKRTRSQPFRILSMAPEFRSLR